MSNWVKKKSVHFNLLTETHAEFRVLAFRKKLSMQEIVDGLISRLVNGDPALVKIVDKIADDKSNKELRKVIGTDAESVFDVIERYDTLKNSSEEK
tara:strand:- start:1529 stop:1816 length:288 start_codon:yes stop_codon:yes gene_type:complete